MSSENAQATKAINKAFKPSLALKTNVTQYVQQRWQELYGHVKVLWEQLPGPAGENK
jgi:hypothetical protein